MSQTHTFRGTARAQLRTSGRRAAVVYAKAREWFVSYKGAELPFTVGMRLQ